MQQQYKDPPKVRNQWRIDPVWQLVGVVLTLTGIVDLVLGYYPNPRIPITVVSIMGIVLCLVVLFWTPLGAAWRSGYKGFRLVFSTYFSIKIPQSNNHSVQVSILLLMGLVLLLGLGIILGVILFLQDNNRLPDLLGFVTAIFAVQPIVSSWREHSQKAGRKQKKE